MKAKGKKGGRGKWLAEFNMLVVLTVNKGSRNALESAKGGMGCGKVEGVGGKEGEGLRWGREKERHNGEGKGGRVEGGWEKGGGGGVLQI